MRKAEIIAAIADETCIPRNQVQVTLEVFFKILRESLTTGEKVKIQRCGTFIIKNQAHKRKSLKRSERTAVDLL